ncbi:hypothetical protein AB0I39_35225 [Kitasatospora purpeofusca]|uniref:hypothetical protein n=1 Tax=Kitasatospora purpeofusca TaxID=67352 RepID=UPI0033D52134
MSGQVGEELEVRRADEEGGAGGEGLGHVGAARWASKSARVAHCSTTTQDAGSIGSWYGR